VRRCVKEIIKEEGDECVGVLLIIDQQIMMMMMTSNDVDENDMNKHPKVQIERNLLLRVMDKRQKKTGP